MWKELKSEKELFSFLHRVAFFHDSCLVKFTFISGAYVDSELSMYPLNDKRILRVLFQRQYADIRSFELEFYGLKHMLFYPTNQHYTCEIESAEMYMRNGFVYLDIPSQQISEENKKVIMNSICATGCRWHIIN